jgi:hypothetical protein
MKELTKGVIYTYEIKSEKVTYKGEHIITSHGSHVFYNIEDNFIYSVKEDSVEVKELKKYPTNRIELPELEEAWFVDKSNKVIKTEFTDDLTNEDKNHKNYPTEKLAEAAQVLPLLIRYRDAWNEIDGFVPDFTDESVMKWTIILNKNKLEVEIFNTYNKLFAFKTKGTADLFLKTFQNDLETLKPLLGGK